LLLSEAAMLRITTAVFLIATATPGRAEPGGCYADWSVAAPIVRKEGLATVEALSRLAQARISGDIVKTTLCKENGGFVYRLVIRSPKGRLFNRTVDARAPFGR
jgi:uncharacterized membrane protein YkoI